MKNCKNKLCFLPHVAAAMVARRVITSLVFICAMSVSSLAQQNAPVNLLTIAPIDKNAPRPDSRNNIDQAIDQVLESDGSITKLKNKAQSDESVKPARKGEVTAKESQEGPPIDPSSKDIATNDNDHLSQKNTENSSNESVPLTVPEKPVVQSAEKNSIKNFDSGVNDNVGGALTSDIYGSAKIGRRKISDVGLAAIGVGDIGNDQLDSKLWRGTSARDAIFLLKRAAVGGQSPAITRLAYEVVARQSVPPSGANNVASDLVEARLAFLANGGRSEDLALLVAQLPKAEKWAGWRRWLAEHYLMTRDDTAACDIVASEITQTLEPFWHKSNVICQAVLGNPSGARFAADILAANGVHDPAFFGLVDEVLHNKPAEEVDATSIDSAHIVLMDVANRTIPLEGLSVLPSQMAETVMKLKFLGPDARMVSTFDGLNRGLISHQQAGKLWRNVGPTTDDPQIALSRLRTNANALTTALAWRAIDADKRPERLSMVPKALKAEIMAGNGALMLPLYAELVRNALTDDAVASTIRFDDLDVAPKLAFMLAISKPSDTTTLSAFGRNFDALQVVELLGGLNRGEIDSDTVSDLNIWHLMPVLDAAGVGINNINWLDLVKSKRWPQRSFVNLSPVLLKAVVSAAKNHHVAETVLLTNWLLHDVSLDKANPADLASVIKALDQIGQSETAKAFTQEVVKAHLMQLLAEKVPNGTES
jgi:hypothetical protein